MEAGWCPCPSVCQPHGICLAFYLAVSIGLCFCGPSHRGMSSHPALRVWRWGTRSCSNQAALSHLTQPKHLALAPECLAPDFDRVPKPQAAPRACREHPAPADGQHSQQGAQGDGALAAICLTCGCRKWLPPCPPLGCRHPCCRCWYQPHAARGRHHGLGCLYVPGTVTPLSPGCSQRQPASPRVAAKPPLRFSVTAASSACCPLPRLARGGRERGPGGRLDAAVVKPASQGAWGSGTETPGSSLSRSGEAGCAGEGTGCAAAVAQGVSRGYFWVCVFFPEQGQGGSAHGKGAHGERE